MSTAAMAAMPAEKVGIASGVLAMDRVMAGTVALAATGAVAHALLGDGDGFAASIAGSTWVLVALCAVGHRAHLGVRPRRRAAQARPAAPPFPPLAWDEVRLTKGFPTCPLGIPQTAFQSDICHPRKRCLRRLGMSFTSCRNARIPGY